jgi:hypothetical protein
MIRSPIYFSFSDTLSGLDTIRAYQAEPRFEVVHKARMDQNQQRSSRRTSPFSG